MSTIKEKFTKFQNSILEQSNKEDIQELLNCYLSSSVCICDSLGVSQVEMSLSDGRTMRMMTVSDKEKDNG